MMNNKIKDYLGIAGIVAVLALVAVGARYVSYYGKSIEPSSFRSFGVTGEGKVTAIPDIALLSFSVVTEGGLDIGALQERNSEKMNGVIAFAKSKDVDAKDIRTDYYSIEPRYENYSCPQNEFGPMPCPPSRIVGYTIRQSVSVKVRKFENIGDLLAGAVNKGANTVSGPSFALDDPAQAESEARAKAIAQAKVKAEAMARAGGFNVGRLLSIEEGFSGPFPYAYGLGGADIREAKAVPAPAIEPGSQEVNITVSLRYEID